MTIDKALRACAWPNTRTLANEIGVDRRTIRRDIDFLRYQLNAPIEFDCVRNGYHYTEPTFCLPFPQLTQGEMLSLYLSERMMRQFKGTPFERDLREAIKTLSELLPAGVSDHLDAIADFLSVLPAVQADYDPELFCAVMRVAVGRRRLKMVYWTASRNETTSRIFDHFELSLIDDGWYAFGYCHRSDEVRMFAVWRFLYSSKEARRVRADCRLLDLEFLEARFPSRLLGSRSPKWLKLLVKRHGISSDVFGTGIAIIQGSQMV
jgi:predicted DNA-binding transcriptional regulator YafY